ncbi:MAG: hypothetical protein NUV48_15440, partial [Peptococcaceae bacterium]|nr:hypothetical protein [Peptococcaceae bacterium]
MEEVFMIKDLYKDGVTVTIISEILKCRDLLGPQASTHAPARGATRGGDRELADTVTLQIFCLGHLHNNLG